MQRVGARDNFFELGGDSVLAGQLVTRVNRSFGVSLSLRDSFKAFTIEELARHVREKLLAKLEAMSDADAERLLGALQEGER